MHFRSISTTATRQPLLTRHSKLPIKTINNSKKYNCQQHQQASLPTFLSLYCNTIFNPKKLQVTKQLRNQKILNQIQAKQVMGLSLITPYQRYKSPDNIGYSEIVQQQQKNNGVTFKLTAISRMTKMEAQNQFSKSLISPSKIKNFQDKNRKNQSVNTSIRDKTLNTISYVTQNKNQNLNNTNIITKINKNNKFKLYSDILNKKKIHQYNNLVEIQEKLHIQNTQNNPNITQQNSFCVIYRPHKPKRRLMKDRSQNMQFDRYLNKKNNKQFNKKQILNDGKNSLIQLRKWSTQFEDSSLFQL